MKRLLPVTFFFLLSIVSNAQSVSDDLSWISGSSVTSATSPALSVCNQPFTYTITSTIGFKNVSTTGNPALLNGLITPAYIFDASPSIPVTFTFSQPVCNLRIRFDDLDGGQNEYLSNIVPAYSGLTDVIGDFSDPTGMGNRVNSSIDNARGWVEWDGPITSLTFNYRRPGPGCGLAIDSISFGCCEVTPCEVLFDQMGPYCSGANISPLPLVSSNGISGTWSPALNNSATTTYTFTPAAGQCTEEQYTTTIVINPVQQPQFNPVGPFCAGENINPLPLVSTNGFSGTWSPPIDNSTTTTYTFTPGAGQCAATTTQTITITPNVTPAFTDIGPYCSGATIPAFATTSTNGITGTWSPAINNTATANYTFTPSAGQCATSSTRTVTIIPNAVPAFTSVGPYCSGAVIPALPAISTNGVAGTWSPAINNTLTTTYTFTPAAGVCATATTLIITVNQNVQPVFTAVGPYCSGETFPELPLTSTNGISGTWSPAINNSTTTSYTFTPDPGQCATEQATTTIVINPVLQPQFSLIDTICSGGLQPSLPQEDLNGIPGTWSPPILSNQASGTYTFMPAAGQCAWQVSLDAVVIPAPVASFGMSSTQIDLMQTGSGEVSFFNFSTGADSYSWDFGDGGTSSDENPVHIFPDWVGNYTITLVASNLYGCEDEASLSLQVNEGLLMFVPNSFTPDGDEFNNTFEAKISGDFDEFNYTMVVFNRWGEVLFETHNVEHGWDGTYNNKLVEEGVYTWKIDLKTKVKDDRRTFVGSVAVLK